MNKNIILITALILFGKLLYAQEYIFTFRGGLVSNNILIEQSDNSFFHASEISTRDHRSFEFALSKTVGDQLIAEIGVGFLDIQTSVDNDFNIDQIGRQKGRIIDKLLYLSVPLKVKYSIRMSRFIELNVGSQLHVNFFMQSLVSSTALFDFSVDGFPNSSTTSFSRLTDQGTDITFGGGLNASINFNITKRLIIELSSSIDWRIGRGSGFDLTNDLISNDTGVILVSNSGRIRPSLNTRSYGIGIGYRFGG